MTTVTTTKRSDHLGRWLQNAQPGTSDTHDFLNRHIQTGSKDYLGRALNFSEPSAWATGTVYAAGAYVKPLTGTAYSAVFVALNGGTSDGSTEPTWPTIYGHTVIDHAGVSQIKWLCVHV